MSVSWDVYDIEQSQTYYAVRVDDAEMTSNTKTTLRPPSADVPVVDGRRAPSLRRRHRLRYPLGHGSRGCGDPVSVGGRPYGDPDRMARGRMATARADGLSVQTPAPSPKTLVNISTGSSSRRISVPAGTETPSRTTPAPSGR